MAGTEGVVSAIGHLHRAAKIVEISCKIFLPGGVLYYREGT